MQEFAPATNAIPASVPNKIPIVTGVVQPPRCDGISFVRGGCNTPLTKEIQPLPLDGVLAANLRDTHRNTKPKYKTETRFAVGWRSRRQPPRYITNMPLDGVLAANLRDTLKKSY